MSVVLAASRCGAVLNLLALKSNLKPSTLAATSYAVAGIVLAALAIFVALVRAERQDFDKNDAERRRLASGTLPINYEM